MPRITPFWNRIPSIFAYGLRLAPLGFGVLAAMIMLVGAMLGLMPWLSLIVFVLIFTYCFDVLESSSEGDPKPPRLSLAVLSQDVTRPLKFIGIFVFFGIMLGTMARFGPIPLIAGLILGAALAPASVIVLGVTDSLLAALNPVMLVRFVIRIGWSYLVLYLFILLMASSRGTVTELIWNVLDPRLALPMTTIIGIYFLVITFHLLGYVVFQFHEVLGGSKPAAIANSKDAAEALRFADFERFLDEGNVDAAIAELEGLVGNAPKDLDLHRKLHTLLATEQRGRRMVHHNRSYLPLLLEAGQHRQAVQCVETTLLLEPDYQPRQPEFHEPLIRALREANKSRLAVKMGDRFHQRFPNHPATPGVYLLMARILCEDLERDDLARRLLKFSAKQFPDHPLAPEITQYQDFMNRLNST